MASNSSDNTNPRTTASKLKNLQEIKNELDSGLELMFVENMDEVLKAALTKNPFQPIKARKKAPKKAKVKPSN